MPRYEKAARKRQKDLSGYEQHEELLGRLALLVMGEGGYVGYYHTWERGVVLMVKWEDDAERFRAETDGEFALLEEEIYQWIMGCKQKAEDKRKKKLM
jgi:hypothetical protein